MSSTRLVQIGVIGAAHGVRGELRVKSFTGDPMALKRYGAMRDEAGGRSFTVETARALKDDMLVVRFKGVATREAAEALTGVGLFMARDALPASDDDEFYHADLIGLRVETTDGTPLGEVVAMHDFGAGDLLEIRLADDRRTVYLPFTFAAVPTIDIAGGRVVVTPPDGALDVPTPGPDEE